MGDQTYAFSEETIRKELLSPPFDAFGEIGSQALWGILTAEANPLLKELLERVESNNAQEDVSFSSALSFLLAEKLFSEENSSLDLYYLFQEVYGSYPSLLFTAQSDLAALYHRDPVVSDYASPFLEFKGYHALQCYRVAHVLWQEKRVTAARFLQSLISEVWGIDIHPAAFLAERIILDHGTGIVIGETAVVERDVVLFQGVTLGGTGKENGKRHPTVRQGVVIGAGSKILGAIEIGRGAKVGAGSVVVKAVEPFTTVFGSPAQIVDRHAHLPALTLDQSLPAIDYIL